jgi:transglutaminase-like putative cysteine protease
MKRILSVAWICSLFLSACGVKEAVELTRTPINTKTIAPTFTYIPSLTLTPIPTKTATPIPWESYDMKITLKIGGVGKLWMPVPRDWDGIGMTNIKIIEISPTPDDLYQEPQGNLIAFWNVNFRSNQEYSILFQADFTAIKYMINSNSIGKYDTSSLDYQLYTQPTKEIQSSDNTIVILAHQIVGNEINQFEQARLIHRWVSENIKSGIYSDALKTLEDKAGDCGGHSNLFIALLRALGIPARSVGGLGTDYATGQLVSVDTKNGYMWGHIWSEFYLPE